MTLQANLKTNRIIDAGGAGECTAGALVTGVNNAASAVVTAATYDAAVGERLVLVDATAAPVAVTLPLVASVPGAVYYVKKLDVSANGVTVDTSGSDTIDAGADVALPAAQFDSIAVTNDGVDAWFVVSQYVA